MRKGDGTSYVYLIRLPHAPHHATKITEAIDGDDSSFFKRRREKCTGQVRPVMLDEVHRSPLLCHNSFCGEQVAYLRDAHTVHGTGTEVQPAMWPQSRTYQFVLQVSLGIARNRNIVWLCTFETCFRGTNGQSRPVLDAIQPFLFQRGHKLS